ncbi:MAG: type IV pilin [Candidatus Thermoplasmatota archaeon]|nr:type IV pilin [Candidatus Thermoplasmatota archaeon]
MKPSKGTINKNAVSAVIGVIIMVAITVAMAAVAYAYFTGMIGEQKTETPVIEFVKSDTEKTIIISTADVDANWNDINIVFMNTTTSASLTIPKSGLINAGDIIDLHNDITPALRGKVTVTFMHIPTNTLLGTYTIDNV